jgi:hypothetical protein
MATKTCMMCASRPAEGVSDFCADCFKKLADRYNRPPEPEAAPGFFARHRRRLEWVLAAACLAVAASRLPPLTAAFAPPKPFRQGPLDTDRATDQCLRHLWTISRLIQEGRWPSAALACPATGRPYLAQGAGPDLLVRCPSPESHRMAELVVGRSRPVPEVRR